VALGDAAIAGLALLFRLSSSLLIALVKSRIASSYWPLRAAMTALFASSTPVDNAGTVAANNAAKARNDTLPVKVMMSSCRPILDLRLAEIRPLQTPASSGA
jgi:hypothetical protein